MTDEIQDLLRSSSPSRHPLFDAGNQVRRMRFRFVPQPVYFDLVRVIRLWGVECVSHEQEVGIGH
jgi:hypothetical protein